MSEKVMLSIKEATKYLNEVLLSMAGAPVEIGELEVLEWIKSDGGGTVFAGKYYVSRGYLDNEIIGKVHLGLVNDLMKDHLAKGRAKK